MSKGTATPYLNAAVCRKLTVPGAVERVGEQLVWATGPGNVVLIRTVASSRRLHIRHRDTLDCIDLPGCLYVDAADDATAENANLRRCAYPVLPLHFAHLSVRGDQSEPGKMGIASGDTVARCWLGRPIDLDDRPTFVADPAELLEDGSEIHHALAQLGPKSMGLCGVVIPLRAAGLLQNISVNVLQVHDLDPRSVRGNEIWPVSA